MTTYREFRYKDSNSRRKTMILSNPREIKFLGADCWTGIVVNKDGEEKSGKGYDREQHIIQAAMITSSRELFMSRKYGWLQPHSDTADADYKVYDRQAS